MDEISRFLIVFMDTLLPLAAGVWLRRLGMDRSWLRLMIRVNVAAVLTALSVVSFWSVQVSAQMLWLPLSIFPICLIPMAVGFVWDQHRFSDPREQGSYIVSMMLGNIGTVSGLAAFSLYGAVGFAYIQLVAVPQILPIALVAFPLGQYYYDRWKHDGASSGQKVSLWKMLVTVNQLPVLGLFAGLLLGASGMEKPAALSPLFTALIHLNAWLGMIPVGYDLSLNGMKRYALRLWPIFPVKFLLLPLALYGMSLCFLSDRAMLVSVVLAAAAPTAIFSVATAQLYRLNVDLAESSFFTTTLFFLFVEYPLLYLWARGIL